MSRGRIEIKVDGDDVGATQMLRMASLTLKILQSIEKEICKKDGTKPIIRWRVDMQSGFNFGLIALRGEQSTSATDDSRLTATWAKVEQWFLAVKGAKP